MPPKMSILVTSGIIISLFWGLCSAQTLVSLKTDQAPVVNGLASDSSWEKAETLTTFDPIANVEIKLKSVHTDKKIFFLIQFPDTDESREHRMWHWNAEQDMYEEGPEREDIFVLKWAMKEGIDDLTLKSDNAYEADIWFWKACRTDPAGYADDKHQQLFSNSVKESTEVLSKSGKKMFLTREGDAGKSSYRSTILTEHEKDIMTRFQTREPEGSRADIVAKGVWRDGKWTIEMARLLVTGNDDDVNFHLLTQSYSFGVSRWEIAGRGPETNSAVPLFGSGDITEPLRLEFK